MPENSIVSVSELFESIQGESSYAGMPCFFVRLSGCNLKCNYCDTPQVSGVHMDIEVSEILERVSSSSTPLVEITGGEPLLQDGFVKLAEALSKQSDKRLLVETNGSMDRNMIPYHAVAIIDVKCPGSGECGSFEEKNLTKLRAWDEVKFVLTDRKDYEWARDYVLKNKLWELVSFVFFSPVVDKLSPKELTKWIVGDGLKVRLQLQLHKVIGVR